MKRVLGLGGFFFRAEDAGGLAEWYPTHLGIDRVPGDYETPPWRQKAGDCVFAPFGRMTEYFGSADRQFVPSFRVRDLQAMIAQLEAATIEVRRDPESQPNGRFAWLNDPEGNQIELWESAA